VIKVHLYWHREHDDLDLGHGYLDWPPTIGMHIVHVAPGVTPEVEWRVVLVQVHAAAPGSPKVRAQQARAQVGANPLTSLLLGADEQAALCNVFVEPAEGPFHP
jgi:hypothetical protein